MAASRGRPLPPSKKNHSQLEYTSTHTIYFRHMMMMYGDCDAGNGARARRSTARTKEQTNHQKKIRC